MHTQVFSGPAPRSWSQSIRFSCPCGSFETVVLPTVCFPSRKASSKAVLPISMPKENVNLLELLGASSMLVNTGSSPKMLFGVERTEKGDGSCSSLRAHRCIERWFEHRPNTSPRRRGQGSSQESRLPSERPRIFPDTSGKVPLLRGKINIPGVLPRHRIDQSQTEEEPSTPESCVIGVLPDLQFRQVQRSVE